jgi:hypothetical protein
MSERFYEQGNQGDQNSWTAPAGNIPGRGNEAPQQGQQGYQQPWTPQGPGPVGNQGSGLLGGALGDVRQAVENQIYQAIDHYGSQVPGGEHFTPEAKNAVSGILDNLQRQLEAQAANRMGNLGGSLLGEGGNQSRSGGQL